MDEFNNLLSQIDSNTTQETDIPSPPIKKVIMYNDDFTTMEFVVKILVSIFNKSYENAEFLMRQIHETGSSVVGEYTFDIAVSRKKLATQVARDNGFPLRIEIE